MATESHGLLGVNIGDTVSGKTFGLGDSTRTDDGGVVLYVEAGSAITQYDCVAVDEDFKAHPASKARVDDRHQIGFAQTAFAKGESGWVHIKGTNISCRFKGNVAADAALYTTSTAGVLDDATTGQTAIQGVTNVAAGGSSAGATVSKEVIAICPHAAS